MPSARAIGRRRTGRLHAETKRTGSVTEDSVEGETAPPSSQQAGVEELRAELQQERDRHLRTRADYESYRRRVDRDRDVAVRHAKRELLLALADLSDGFDRALAHVDESPDSVTAGLYGMRRRLGSLLEAEGVTTFDSVGQRFDPTRHEAMATVRDRGRRAGNRRLRGRPPATSGTTSCSAPPACASRNSEARAHRPSGTEVAPHTGGGAVRPRGTRALARRAQESREEARGRQRGASSPDRRRQAAREQAADGRAGSARGARALRERVRQCADRHGARRHGWSLAAGQRCAVPDHRPHRGRPQGHDASGHDASRRRRSRRGVPATSSWTARSPATRSRSATATPGAITSGCW